MFFLNLTAAEFFTLLGVLGGVITALYMLDRTRRRKIVSTLRFWPTGGAADVSQSRRRVREPWSLILQLLGLLFLLLALARLEWGIRNPPGRNHVVLLDTSAWSAQMRADGGTALDEEKALARRYIASLSAADRVILLAVDDLAGPKTHFGEDRAELLAALARLQSGLSALNLHGALAYSVDLQKFAKGAPGEIVYIGPGLTEEDSSLPPPTNLRYLPVHVNRENIGIRRLTVKQSDEEGGDWHASVLLKNNGDRERLAHLAMRFGSTEFSSRAVRVPPRSEQTVEYSFTTHTSGTLSARVIEGGSLSSDDQASAYLPVSAPVRLLAFTNRPEMLRPLFPKNTRMQSTFKPVDQYSPQASAEIFVLDGFAPASPPRKPALFIAPPKEHAPIPVKDIAKNANLHWIDSPLGLSLRAKPLLLREAAVFQTFNGDTTVAEVHDGPVAVVSSADSNHGRLAVIGFDLLNGELRYEIATPLLFASLIEWLDPGAFRSSVIDAQPVGLVSVVLQAGENPKDIRVLDDRGATVPYAIHENSVQIYAASPRVLRIISSANERTVSLALPQVPSSQYRFPDSVPNGVPSRAFAGARAVDLWKWLTILGAACLTAEWLIWGRNRSAKRRARSSPEQRIRSGSREEELALR